MAKGEKKPHPEGIDAQAMHDIEALTATREAQTLKKELAGIDKAKLMEAFSKLDKETIRARLQNIDADTLKKAMQNKDLLNKLK